MFEEIVYCAVVDQLWQCTFL